MQAILLAAGMGKRLKELTRYKTKCMIEVAGEKIIDRMLRGLLSININKIVIVTGHGHEELKSHIINHFKNDSIEFIHNDLYETTNNIYSLSLAKEYLEQEDSIILESDIVFQNEILCDLLNHPSANVAVIAKYEHWMNGTMAQIDENQNIIKLISKNEFDFNHCSTYYKTVNIYKFSKEFSSTKYLPFLEAYIASFGQNQFYEQVLNIAVFIEKTIIQCLILKEQNWYEIDDELDLSSANIIFRNEDKFSKLTQSFGGYWRYSKLIDFCYLANPYFPTKRLKEELKYMFEKLLTSYPSGNKINNLLASHLFNIDKDYICLANGASELIKILAETLEGKIGIIYPTFEEYHKCFGQKNIIPYYVNNKEFRYTIQDLISFYEKEDVETILLVNPDNPSGNYINRDNIKIFIEWTATKGINLIIDESFIDFASSSFDTSLNNKILESNKKLIVIKSISKSYGIPGLRLGVLASSNKDLLELLKQKLPIWNINSFAEYFLQSIKCHMDDYKHSCTLLRLERERFFTLLTQIEFLQVLPSEANYFLCKISPPYTSNTVAKKLLEGYNLLIKDCSNKIGMSNSNWIRITIRNKEENDFMIFALNNIRIKNEKAHLHKEVNYYSSK